jgi:hypothetical protein
LIKLLVSESSCADDGMNLSNTRLTAMMIL